MKKYKIIKNIIFKDQAICYNDINNNNLVLYDMEQLT